MVRHYSQVAVSKITEMGDDDDATNQMMQEIQTTNDISTHFLTSHGYNSDAVKVTVKK